jgi:hypothetical protein
MNIPQSSIEPFGYVGIPRLTVLDTVDIMGRSLSDRINNLCKVLDDYYEVLKPWDLPHDTLAYEMEDMARMEGATMVKSSVAPDNRYLMCFVLENRLKIRVFGHV